MTWQEIKFQLTRKKKQSKQNKLGRYQRFIIEIHPCKMQWSVLNSTSEKIICGQYTGLKEME